MKAIRPVLEATQFLLEHTLPLSIPLQCLWAQLLGQGYLLVTQCLASTNFIKAVSSACSVIRGNTEILRLVRLFRRSPCCGNAFVAGFTQGANNRSVSRRKVVVVAAKVFRRKLPVRRNNVALLARNNFEAAQLFADQKVIQPPFGVAKIFVE